MDFFNNLSQEEREEIYRAPVLFAVLAAVSDDGEISQTERTDAIKLAHLRTYTSPKILHDFYGEVDKIFEKEFDKLSQELPSEEEEQKKFLEQKIDHTKQVMKKLDRDYAIHLTQSLKSFSRHIFKSESSLLEYFILPVIMSDLEKDL
jgi:hypothetical protein